MNTSAIVACSAIIAAVSISFDSVRAQEASAELPDDATLASLQLDYDILRAEAMKPVKELDALYAGNLEKLRDEAQQGGQLSEVLAVQAELEGFREGTSPEAPESSPQLRRLQTIYQEEKQRRFAAENMRPLRRDFLRNLHALQTRLTQQGKIEEAVAVSETIAALEQQREDEAVSSSPVSALAATDNPTRAAKDQPFENSLGMRFVPVSGTEVLFCIHETRYRDYEAYAEENPGIDGGWRNQTIDGFAPEERPEDHPVVRMNWGDAQKFCEWLSQKEGRTYRLPTDREWSVAVGLGRKERWGRSDTPESVAKDQNEFPWGTAWPPPAGAGNYSDQSRKAKAPRDGDQYLEGYDDGYPTTAPVMGFAPNEFGLYDMGGNVWEWMEDQWSNEQESRVLRGASFYRSERDPLLASHRPRPGRTPVRRNDYGFRLVLSAR